MFKRRNPLSFFQNLRQVFWPKMGWWRMGKYYHRRITRMTSSPESIAFNMAGGSAMSLTPFFGLHIFGAMGAAWIFGFRMNIIASTVGTLVGNPWTFPFFLYAEHRVGNYLLGLFGVESDHSGLTPAMVEQQGDNLLGYLWENFTDLFAPTALGGSVLCILSFPFFYGLYLYLVRAAQKARRHRLSQKQMAMFNEKAKNEQDEA